MESQNMQPNKENIRKWVTALRSGEFTQTQGVLKNSSGYCCLGVLCEVAAQNGLNLDVSKTFTDEDEPCVAFDGEWSVAPPKVVEWAGIEKGNPSLLGDERAAELNDENGLSFEELADLIEQKYLIEDAA